MSNYLYMVIVANIATLIGFVCGLYARFRHPDAEFVINTSDPNKDVFTIKFDTLEGVEKKKYIIAKVIDESTY